MSRSTRERIWCEDERRNTVTLQVGDKFRFDVVYERLYHSDVMLLYIHKHFVLGALESIIYYAYYVCVGKKLCPLCQCMIR